MVECAILVALACVLSVFKLVEMPYGGSVTLASALPIIIAAYRHGSGWGILSGFTFAVVQQLLGLKTLSYVTGWQSVVAVILIDYILAFTLLGLGGIFKKIFEKQSTGMAVGAVFACLMRYGCHVIAGATVWRGLSIPDSAAMIYSLGYNATYMLPETVVLTVAAVYLGSLLDFSRPTLARLARGEEEIKSFPYLALAGASLLVAAIADVVLLAPYLQDEEGMFTFTRLGEANLLAVLIVSAVCALVAFIAVALKRIKKNG